MLDKLRRRVERIAAPTLEIPAPLTVAVDGQQVAWSADLGVAWDYFGVELFAPGVTRLNAGASAGWVEARGEARIAVPDLAALPGWHSELASFVDGDDVRWGAWGSRGHHAGDYAGALRYQTPCGMFDVANEIQPPQYQRQVEIRPPRGGIPEVTRST